jgi:hypothetical protein
VRSGGIGGLVWIGVQRFVATWGLEVGRGWMLARSSSSQSLRLDSGEVPRLSF